MHAVMVKFASTVALADLRGFFEEQRSVLHSVEGLLGTTWTAEEDVLGGFLLFSDQAAAEEYLRSDVFDAMLLNACFEHFRVQHSHVVDHSDQRAILRRRSATCADGASVR